MSFTIYNHVYTDTINMNYRGINEGKKMSKTLACVCLGYLGVRIASSIVLLTPVVFSDTPFERHQIHVYFSTFDICGIRTLVFRRNTGNIY
jgi:hypothetical protein